MLSIRLMRVGTTKKPHYRVVVADSRAWRDGRFVETLGHYDPRRQPAVVKIDTALQSASRLWMRRSFSVALPRPPESRGRSIGVRGAGITVRV